MKPGNMKQRMLVAPVAAAVICMLSGGAMAKKPVATDTFVPDPAKLEALGKEIFFDTNMSTPGNKQGCVSCHDPRAGWTFPDSEINLGQVVNPGAKPHATGLVKPPTIAYAAFVEPFFNCGTGRSGHCGGLFWDGRAEGWGLLASDDTIDPPVLGPLGDGVVSETVTKYDLPDAVAEAYMAFLGPLADQALNPAQKGVEQNAGEKKVCQRVKTAPYKALYKEAFGENIDCGSKPKDNPAYHVAFKRIAVAIAAFEKSDEVSPFSSPRDTALYRELACADAAGNGGVPTGEFIDYWNSGLCTTLSGLKAAADFGKFPLAFVGEYQMSGEAGTRLLTQEEIDQINRGHDLFYGVESDLNPAIDRWVMAGRPAAPTQVVAAGNANCWNCHANNVGIDDGSEPRQLYTNHSYHNIGTPFNKEIPGVEFGEIVGQPSHAPTISSGRPSFKTPTLRQVDTRESPEFVKAYAHNGYFKSVESIVHFYNTFFRRLVDLEDPASGFRFSDNCFDEYGIEHATEAEALGPDWESTGIAKCWPDPESFDSIGFNTGQLGLTLDEEDALVAYIKALTDTVVVEAP
ncbi:MAG: hypothetical protein KDI04_00325 [Halieaceae bacterium]|nr:hypothetical protein [Halieaceae bacterium]MCP5147573.1 hypothetical protein [Pseudomonadales bacterium]